MNKILDNLSGSDYFTSIHPRVERMLKGERAEVICVEEVSKHYGD